MFKTRTKAITKGTWAILSVAIAGALLALSVHALSQQAGQPDGEWVADTPAAQANSAVCTPTGCIEWCKYTESGFQPSGQLCCADAEGNCIQGTIFYP